MTTPFQVCAAIVTGSGSSRSYPVANATAAGDTLTALAIVNNTAGTVSALTDSQGNVYILDDSFTSAQPMLYAFRCPGATGGPGSTPTKALSISDTFTLTTATASANIQLYVTDAGPVGALDNTPAIAIGASTTPSVSATPATNGDTAVSMFGTAFAGGSPTVNSPFTGLGSFNTGSNPYGTGAYDQISGGSGTPLSSTLTIVSANWRAIMWLFQPGASGITGTGALTEAGQALAGSGTVPVTGTGTLTEAGQALAGSGTVPVTGAGGLAESGQALAGSGAITPRQLILSIAPAAGTDYPAGLSVGAAGSQQLQALLSGLVAVLKMPSGAAWEQFAAELSSVAGGSLARGWITTTLTGASTNGAGAADRVQIQLWSGVSDGSAPAQLILFYEDTSGGFHQYATMDDTGLTIAAGAITAAGPGSSPAAPETWHTISSGFPSGWSGTFQYKMLPFRAVAVRAEFVLSSATVADGTVLLTLPATGSDAYWPADLQSLPVTCDVLKVSGSAFEGAALRINSAGQVMCYGIGAAATYLQGSGLYFLDS